MKILVISRGVPSQDDPQWGSFEWDQVQALRQQGHNVCVLSVESRKKTIFRGLKFEERVIEGVNHYNIVCGPIGVLKYVNDSIYIAVLAFFFSKLYQRVVRREGKPDVIYAHYSHIIAMVAKAAKNIGVPIVGMEHWSELGKPAIQPSILKRSRFAYRRISQLLVVSSALQQNIKRHIGVDSVVIPNIVGKEFIYNSIKKDNSCVDFISVGSLFPIKCMDLIIQSFSKIKEQIHDWHLTIVGAGPEYSKLQNLIVKSGLSEKIQLVGRKTREEIVKLFNSSDVYILSSSSETFGVAAAEAIACGLPIISTDCGGPSDFVNDNNGVLISINDVEALRNAIVYMIENHNRYDCETIAEECHARFSQEAIGKQLTDIFKIVINRNK